MSSTPTRPPTSTSCARSRTRGVCATGCGAAPSWSSSAAATSVSRLQQPRCGWGPTSRCSRRCPASSPASPPRSCPPSTRKSIARPASTCARTHRWSVSASPPARSTPSYARTEPAPGDAVLVGIGIVPNVELAARAGLAVDDGILVGSDCRTSDPAILAIGDCTNYPCTYVDRRVRLESEPSTLAQARCAASLLCRTVRPHTAIPWFWSDQYDLTLQTVGLSSGHDQLVLRGDPAECSFLAFYLRNGKPIAADAISRPREFSQLRKSSFDRRATRRRRARRRERPPRGTGCRGCMIAWFVRARRSAARARSDSCV